MRVRAGRSDKVDLNDEMDHFGMYIMENNYKQYAEELSENADRWSPTATRPRSTNILVPC